MISVIIPCYNNEKYIEDAVNSVLFGKYQDFEILIINDGSPDNSLNIINNLANKDKRIKVINQSHGGVSKARNTGIDNAKGEYIAFIDGDDFVSYDYLDSLSKFAVDNNLDWIRCGYRYFTDTGKTYSEERGLVFSKDTILSGEQLNDSIYEIVIYYMPSNCMSLFKTNIIKDNNLRLNEDITYGEDLLFNYEYSHFINSFGCLYKGLYVYRKHFDSKMINIFLNNDDYLGNTILLFENLIKLAQKYNDDIFDILVNHFAKHTEDYFRFIVCAGNKEKCRLLANEYYDAVNNNIYTKKLYDGFNYKKFTNKKRKIFVYLLKNKYYNLIYYFVKSVKT